VEQTRQECIDCGGKCCQIYSGYSYSHGSHIHEGEKDYGVSPLFDRRKVDDILNLCEDDSEGYIKNLLGNNIDPSFCEYRHPDTGCIIPRDKRSYVCTAYYCGSDYHRWCTNGTPSFPTKYWDKDGNDLRLPRVKGTPSGDYIYFKCPYCGEKERIYKRSSSMTECLAYSYCRKGHYVREATKIIVG